MANEACFILASRVNCRSQLAPVRKQWKEQGPFCWGTFYLLSLEVWFCLPLAHLIFDDFCFELFGLIFHDFPLTRQLDKNQLRQQANEYAKLCKVPPQAIIPSSNQVRTLLASRYKDARVENNARVADKSNKIRFLNDVWHMLQGVICQFLWIVWCSHWMPNVHRRDVTWV